MNIPLSRKVNKSSFIIFFLCFILIRFIDCNKTDNGDTPWEDILCGVFNRGGFTSHVPETVSPYSVGIWGSEECPMPDSRLPKDTFQSP